MSKRAALPQTNHHLPVYNEDWEFIETRFGLRGLKPVGTSSVIRALIHKAVLEWREAENAAATAARRTNTHAHPTDINGPSRSPPGEHI